MLFNINHKEKACVIMLFISLFFAIISYIKTIELKQDIIHIEGFHLKSKYKNYKLIEFIQVLIALISIFIYYEFVFIK